MHWAMRSDQIFSIFFFILGMSAAISPLNVLGESLTDCIILLISAVILFVLAKTKKDNVKMGRRGLRTVVYCIHSISADQVKIAQIWER